MSLGIDGTIGGDAGLDLEKIGEEVNRKKGNGLILSDKMDVGGWKAAR